jgi:hypothetical protein
MSSQTTCPICGEHNVRVSEGISESIHEDRGKKIGARVGIAGGIAAGLAIAATAATGGLAPLIIGPAIFGFGGNEVGKFVGSFVGKPAGSGKLGYYCEDCKNRWT